VKFQKSGIGCFFKGRDPNEEIDVLESNRVHNSRILYIGRAGGQTSADRLYRSTLRKRICQYIRLGYGESAAHRGDRYIWQIRDSKQLLIGYRTTDMIGGNPNPVKYEHYLLAEYLSNYGRLPFANLAK